MSLSEKLLEQNKYWLPIHVGNVQKTRLRMSERDEIQNNTEQSLQLSPEQINKKLRYSTIQKPKLIWNDQQILQRSLILQRENSVDKVVSQMKEFPKVAKIQSAISKLDGNGLKIQSSQMKKKKKAQLNYIIFHMKKSTQKCLYYFNLFFNCCFRIGLIVLLAKFIMDNQQSQGIFVSILVGLEGIVCLLYFLALTKILYTKSQDMSIHFQRQFFFEKSYAQIHMQRILRKHFTIKRIISNLCRLANPTSKFNTDIKISLIKQEIYKRMQLVIVFLPLLFLLILGVPWFKKQKNIQGFNPNLLLAIVVSVEICRTTFHYLTIYIFA